MQGSGVHVTCPCDSLCPGCAAGRGINGTGGTVRFNRYGDDKIMMEDLMIVMVFITCCCNLNNRAPSHACPISAFLFDRG